MTSGLALAALLVVARSAPAQEPTPTAITRTLPNGVRVVARHAPSGGLVAIDVWVRAGSAWQAPGESGAAHFLEHLLFRGTARRAPGQLDAAIEDLGALVNAGTTRDAAHIHAVVASGAVEPALAAICEAVRGASFPPPEVEKERGVILDEMARSRGDAVRVAVDRVYAGLFGPTGYGRSILGNAEEVRRMPRDEIAAFHRRLYRPERTVAVFCGDIAPVDALRLADRFLGDWQGAGQEPGAALPAPPPPTGRAAAAPASLPPGARGALAIGMRTDGIDASGAAAASVAAGLLADAFIGRLHAALRAGGGALPAGASFVPLTSGGVFVVTVSGPAADLAAAREAVMSSLRQLAAGAFGDGDLAFVKRRLAGQFLLDTETCAGQARALGESAIVGDAAADLSYPSRLAAVRRAGVEAFARRYLDPARAVDAIEAAP